MTENSLKYWLDKLERYCAFQERCISDVRKKMISLKTPKEYTEEILKTLLEAKFIDEDRYVRTYMRSKVHIKKDGLEKIRFALKQKGIKDSDIDPLFQELDKDIYLDNLKILIQKKSSSLLAKNDPWETKQKLTRYLLSKGYKYEDFKELLS